MSVVVMTFTSPKHA